MEVKQVEKIKLERCVICGGERITDWNVRFPNTSKDLKLCNSCLLDYINMDFEKLLNKLEKKNVI